MIILLSASSVIYCSKLNAKTGISYNPQSKLYPEGVKYNLRLSVNDYVLSQGNYVFKLTGLQLPKRYNISVNNKWYPAQVEKDGTLTIKHDCEYPVIFSVKEL